MTIGQRPVLRRVLNRGLSAASFEAYLDNEDALEVIPVSAQMIVDAPAQRSA